MRRSLSPTAHGVLLLGFALLMCVVWLLPVLFIGYSYWLPQSVLNAKTFVETGVLIEENMRWMPIVLAPFHAFIAWDDVMGWTILSVILMALSLIPLWVAVRQLCDRTIAWLAVVFFALFPMNWVIALELDGYAIAFFFLFLGFVLYQWQLKERRLLAIILFGLCFGFTLASRDAFLALLPGFAAAYLWHRRKKWKTAIPEIFLSACAAYVTLTLPLISNALHPDMTLTERVAVFLPAAGNAMPEEGHLYPDEYTYQQDKEEYDAILRERAKTESFLEGRNNANYKVLFGVTSRTLLTSAFNTAWVFFNALPSFIHPQMLGGAFIFLFVIPGMIWMWKQKKSVVVSTILVWLAMEFLLRVILLFARTHLMDMGGIVALFAGAGVFAIATAYQTQRKGKSMTGVCFVIVAIAALQLFQINRTQFAALYLKSEVPTAHAAAKALSTIPADAIIAHPRKPSLFYFDAHKHVTIHPETIDRLAPAKRLAEPFKFYGVTHIIGYGKADEEAIRAAVPGINVIQIPDTKDFNVEYTPLLKYVLNAFR